MEILEFIFGAIKYLVIGFFSLLGILVVLAVLFGKRIEKKWEYEADFYDDSKKEIGEFEIELFRYEKEKGDFQLKVQFELKHSTLVPGNSVDVYLDDVLVLEGMVEKEGRIVLNKSHLKSNIDNPQAGQMCTVKCSGIKIASAELHPD